MELVKVTWSRRSRSGLGEVEMDSVKLKTMLKLGLRSRIGFGENQNTFAEPEMRA